MKILMQGRPSGSRDAAKSRGMVTAEIAVGILSLAVLTAIMAFTISLISLRGACADVAAQVARQLARDDQVAAAAAQARAPQGSRVEVRREGSLIIVQVSAEARFGNVGSIPISATAVSDHE